MLNFVLGIILDDLLQSVLELVLYGLTRTVKRILGVKPSADPEIDVLVGFCILIASIALALAAYFWFS